MLNSARTLRRRAAVAFVLLAALATVSHGVLWQAGAHARGGAALVNALGRQRTTAAHVALAGYAAAYAAADAPPAERAARAAAFRAAHAGWRQAQEALGGAAVRAVPAAAAALDAVGPAVARMSAQAARLDTLLGPAGPAADQDRSAAAHATLAEYTAAQALYVAGMDRALGALAADLDRAGRTSGPLTLGFLGLSLGVIGALYAGSVRPAARGLVRAAGALGAARDALAERNAALAAQQERLREHNEELAVQQEELLAQQEELARQADELEQLATVVRQTDDAVTVSDAAGRLTWANAAWERMTGWCVAEAVGATPDALLRCADTHPDVALGIREAVAAGTGHVGEALFQRRDGTRYWAAHTLSPVRRADGAVRGFVTIERDVTEHKRHEHALEQLSLRDELTGLYNRRGFQVMARHALEMASRSGTSCLLVCGDLDGLKVVNDTHGHPAGDAVLAEVAQVLRATFRASDVIARVGGDEFTVLAHGAAGETESHVRARLDEAFARANAQPGRSWALAMSVGCAPVPAGTVEGLDRLLVAADAALYTDKRARRSDGPRPLTGQA